MAEYYKGEEIKFAINIDAPGFDMDTDDFEIEVASKRDSVVGYKDAAKAEDTALVIFKEESDSSDSSSDSSSPEGGSAQWYGIVDTSALSTGELRVISKAYIPDANANDNIRVSIDVKPLATLKNP